MNEEPERPSDAEEAEIAAQIEREFTESIERLFAADDKTAAMGKEIRRQAEEIAVLKSSRNSSMNEKAAAIRQCKAERQKNDRLERAIKRLKLQVENLTEQLAERIAIQQEST